METELGGIKLGRDVNLIPFKDFAHMTSLLNIVMSVSYTHIDVYKRQV